MGLQTFSVQTRTDAKDIDEERLRKTLLWRHVRLLQKNYTSGGSKIRMTFLWLHYPWKLFSSESTFV